MILRRWFLKRSIKRYGVRVPIIMTEDGVVLDGTNRLRIAQELGIKIPCAIVSAEIVELEPSELESES